MGIIQTKCSCVSEECYHTRQAHPHPFSPVIFYVRRFSHPLSPSSSTWEGLANCTKPTGAETQIHELGMPPVQSSGREFVGIKRQGILPGPDSLLVLRRGTQKELGLEWSPQQPKHPFVLPQSTLLCRHCSVLKKIIKKILLINFLSHAGLVKSI